MTYQTINQILANTYVGLLEKKGAKSKYKGRIGVTLKKRDIPIAISLTSIPARLDKHHLNLETLLDQSV